MTQRTCNIIMCCKGRAGLAGADKTPRNAIAAYMANECQTSVDYYTNMPPNSRLQENPVMEHILRTALFDYFETADKPGFELRRLLQEYVSHEPTLCDRIINVFQLCDIRNNGHLVNGFTDELLAQSDKDLKFG